MTPASGFKIVQVDPVTGELFTQRACNRTVWKVGQESRHESTEPIVPCESGLHFSECALDTYNYFSVIVPDQLEQPKLALHRVMVPFDLGATVLPCQSASQSTGYKKFVTDRLVLDGPVTGSVAIDPVTAVTVVGPRLYVSLDSDGMLHSSRTAYDEIEHLNDNCLDFEVFRQWMMPSYVVRAWNNRSRFFVHGRLALSVPSSMPDDSLVDPSQFMRTRLKVDDQPIMLLSRTLHQRLVALFTDPERAILAELVHFSAIASESNAPASELFRIWVAKHYADLSFLRRDSLGLEDFIRTLYVHLARPLGSLEPLRAFRALLPHCREWHRETGHVTRDGVRWTLKALHSVMPTKLWSQIAEENIGDLGIGQ